MHQNSKLDVSLLRRFREVGRREEGLGSIHHGALGVQTRPGTGILPERTGLRKGSILRLAAENYLNEPGVLRVIQKGGRELKLPMTPPLKKVLDGLGIAAGPLFQWPDGRVMHRFPRKAWARACVKAGLDVEKPDPKHPSTPRKVPAIRFHDLRHCMGTVLAEAGIEQRLIQELLGHSGIRISERYTRPRRPALRRAALKATRLMGVEPSV